MVFDGPAREERRVAPLVVGAAAVALLALISVVATLLSGDGLSGGAAAVPPALAVVLVLAAVSRRRQVPWWWAASLAGVGALVFSLGHDPVLAMAEGLDTRTSSLELTWLAVAVVLVCAVFGVGDRLDTTPHRLSRLDGALAGASAASALALVLAPMLQRVEAPDGRVALLGAHALFVVVSVAVAARQMVVSRDDRFLPVSLLVWSVAGLIRNWAELDGSVATVEWTAAGGVFALGTLLVGVGLPRRRPTAVRTSEFAHERVGLVAVCGIAPAIVALGQTLRETEVDATILAVGTTVVLLLVAARLHFVVGAVREGAERTSAARQATVLIAGARERRQLVEAAVEAAVSAIGTGARIVAWVREDAFNSYEVVACEDRLGDHHRHHSGITAVLDAYERTGEVEVLETRSGWAAVVPVVDRPFESLVVTTAAPVTPVMVDALRPLAMQASAALEAISREEQLLAKRSEARFEELVRHTNDAIIIVDRAGRVAYQSPSVVRLLGYLAVDLDGRDVRDIVADDGEEAFDRFLHRHLTRAAHRSDPLPVTLLKADGEPVDTEVLASNLLDNPDVEGVVLTVRDVTRHRELERQLRHQAYHDALTGLANRSLLVERLGHALAVNRRSELATPAVAFIDLDDFKEVNDTLGHAAGDRLLRTIASRIEDCIRAGDTAARFGGDEFAVLFEQPTSADDLAEACQRLIDVLQTPVTIGDEVVEVGASIGLATRHDGLGETGEILRCADLAMYAAKEAGKGRVARFQSEMHDAMVAQLSSNRDLERAVANDQLRVCYQPIVEVASGEVRGFEALVRWQHPTRGLVSPADFVPAAESIGVIGAVGRWVLEQATNQLAEWNRRSVHTVSMHVNVSAHELQSPEFGPTVRGAIETSEIDPSCLVLDLTESVLLGDDGLVLDRVAALHEFGVRIAVDDFGTGYSSLSYLQRMPFDLLKIDRSFIESLGSLDPDETLARTIVDLAERLGVEAIAEGVERPIERDGLVQLGCRYAQGYLYGRPVEASEAGLMFDRRILRPVPAATA